MSQHLVVFLFVAILTEIHLQKSLHASFLQSSIDWLSFLAISE